MVDALQKLDRLKRSYKAGDVIIQEGDQSTDFFILIQGVAEVYKGERKLSEIAANTGEIFFGEMASILHEKRSASVIAKDNCTVLAVPADGLLKVLQLSPSLLEKLLRQLASRVGQLNKTEIGLESQVDEMKVELETRMITAMNYFKSIIGIMEILALQIEHEALVALKDYVINTNPFSVKSGNTSSLDMAAVDKYGLGPFLK